MQIDKHSPSVVSVFGVEPRRIGGNETFAHELSLQLQARGWRSVLCFLSDPPPAVRSFLELPNVSIEVLEDSWQPNFTTARKLALIIRRYQPQIVHLHFVGFLSILPWTARLFSVKRVFFTDQSSRPAHHIIRRAPFWKRQIVRCVNWPLTKIICISKYNYRCMTALDVLPRERYEQIYNSVDFSRVAHEPGKAIQFRQEYGIPLERKVVVQVSWIIPEKGIVDLLEAARRVLLQTKQVQFVIVGEGSHREEYTRLGQQLGIEDHVSWTGLIEDPFDAGVYDAADIVCQVSRWQEAFGWVIAEAMAYSRPVIGTNVGGIPELVNEGETGLLVPPGEPAELAEKMQLLLNNDEMRKRMGLLGYEAAVDKFDLRKNVGRVLELYQL